jgi:hypothetical protein
MDTLLTARQILLQSIDRTSVSLGKTAGFLDERQKNLEAAGPAGTSSSLLRDRAQELVDLITALETARFLTFRAACLAAAASEEAEVEAAKCEKLVVEISERAAVVERPGRSREGERP